MKNIFLVAVSFILFGCGSSEPYYAVSESRVYATSQNGYSNYNSRATADFIQILGDEPIVKVTPRYPYEAIQSYLFGVVSIQFTVDESGMPVDISVVNEASSLLVEPAIEALEQSRYHPKFAGHTLLVDAKFSINNG